MFFFLFFVWNRVFQMLTLIPTVGMLGWFVHGYTEAMSLTPNSILILFIVSTLALSWAVLSLFFYHRSSRNASFVALVDALFFGAFIAAVYFLRGIATADCTNVTSSSDDWTVDLGDVQITGPGVSLDWRTNKRCAMLKASFAFGIMNIIAFFITAISAWLHGDGIDEYRSRDRHSHSDRHSHRRRSHSGSRHSHHSHRRVYV